MVRGECGWGWEGGKRVNTTVWEAEKNVFQQPQFKNRFINTLFTNRYLKRVFNCLGFIYRALILHSGYSAELSVA
jgi:hypothetical protein